MDTAITTLHRTDLDHPLRGPLNAWFFDWMDAYLHWKTGAEKARLFAGLPTTVVEIGPGAGANLRYYAPGTRLVAIEPNVHMHARLRHNAERRGIELEIHAAGAERMPLESESVDAVTSTLVLCSVPDVEGALAEVRRVLRPGGAFLSMEHVRGPDGSALGVLQRWIRAPWRWLFEGCDVCRDLEGEIRRAGFARVETEPKTVRTAFLPVRPQIVARCVK